MFRTIPDTRDTPAAPFGSIPRPVVALFFLMRPESADSQKERSAVLPIGDFLRQEIGIRLPTLPFQDPRTKLVMSIQDNRNDQLNDSLILPPLRTGEFLTIADVKPFQSIALKVEPKSVLAVENSQLGMKYCNPNQGYSESKVMMNFQKAILECSLVKLHV
jgi:hypothetical protein